MCVCVSMCLRYSSISVCVYVCVCCVHVYVCTLCVCVSLGVHMVSILGRVNWGAISGEITFEQRF